MSILKFVQPKSATSIAEALEALDRQTAAAQSRRPALLAELDAAVVAGSGEAAAEDAVLQLDSEIARLALRRGALERAHAAAVEREHLAHIEALRREHADARAAADKAAKDYDRRAAGVAEAARTLAAEGARVDRANRSLELAGAEPLSGAPGDHVIRDLHLPHSRWNERPHHAAEPTLDPRVVALGEMVRDSRAAGARAVDNVKNIAAKMLAVAHSG